MGVNLGRWDVWYRHLGPDPEPYGGDTAYLIGAEWLSGMDVEDWGCGKGWMRRFVPPDRYRGVDGTASPFADEVVDLEEYRSDVDGLFMRGVLEHNYNWQRILDNAIASFRHRMFLAVFTPFADETREVSFCAEVGVPDLAFRREDLLGPLEAVGNVRVETVPTATHFGREHLFYVEREKT